MKIDARLTHEKLRHDQDNDTHLVLTLTAPALVQTQKRPRICIIPVLDISPSMAGSKIEYAKRSIEKLIDHLAPDDYCGLVVFDRTARIVEKPRKVSLDTKQDLKRKLTNLPLGSGTNIADALLVGLEVANKMDLGGEIITRVILFTDGEANCGPAIATADILRLVEPNRGVATVSAFGYGQDANQQLLSEMAKLGRANYAFVENPDDALTAFGKELGGLISTYATNIEIRVSPLDDHTISDVISDVDVEEEKVGHDVTIKLPDILAEETRHIVIAVKLKAQGSGGPRAVNVFEVKAGFDTLDANSHKERKGTEAKAKTQFVKKGDEQAKPDEELDKIVGLAEVIRAQIEAEVEAKKGNFRAAQQRMNNVQASVGSRGHQHLQQLTSNISSRLDNSVNYNSGGSYLASVSRGGTRGFGVASYEVSAAADLGHVGVVMSNSVQASTSTAFSGGAGVHTVLPAPDGHFNLNGGADMHIGAVVAAAPAVFDGVFGSIVVDPVDGPPVTPPPPPLPRTNSKTPDGKSASGSKPAKKIAKKSARW